MAASGSSTTGRGRRIFVTFHQIRAIHELRSHRSHHDDDDVAAARQKFRRRKCEFAPVSEETLRNSSISDPSQIHVSQNHYYVLMRELRENGYSAEANVTPNRAGDEKSRDADDDVDDINNDNNLSDSSDAASAGSVLTADNSTSSSSSSSSNSDGSAADDDDDAGDDHTENPMMFLQRPSSTGANPISNSSTIRRYIYIYIIYSTVA
jgi:hypothetical protein